jgi:light-regulated signal transduction histidine kinase (bacteriophytochrome)
MTTIKTYLYSIFFNLITNSIKYRHQDRNPIIKIKSYQLELKIMLTFKDNGLGFDINKNESQLFGLYKRFYLHVEGKSLGYLW